MFWLCDFAREPGAGTTRFTNAVYDCPGDDDREHVLSAGGLIEALDATFAIVEVPTAYRPLRTASEKLDMTGSYP